MRPLFEKKVLESPKRVCLRLREARLAHNVTLEELAIKTRIDKKYLEALEECRYEVIPYSSTYKKTFIKKYAAVLAMDGAELARQFIDEEELTDETKKEKIVRKLHMKRLYNTPILLRSLLIFAVVVVGCTLLAMQIKRIIDPPSLSLAFPYDGYVTTEQTIRLDGHIGDGAQLLINGQPTVTGEAGAFTTPVTLAPGTNTIVITAEKKHGKTTVLTRHVVLRSDTTVDNAAIISTEVTAPPTEN